MPSKVFTVVAALCLTLLVACSRQEPGANSPAREGLVRVDASDPASAVRITVLNSSKNAHELRILLPGGPVLLDARVPALANREPAVWRGFSANVAGMPITFDVDGCVRDFIVQRDTKEIVLEVGIPIMGPDVVRQSPQRIQWR